MGSIAEEIQSEQFLRQQRVLRPSPASSTRFFFLHGFPLMPAEKREGRPLPFDIAGRFALDCAQGLRYLHEHKPEEVRVSPLVASSRSVVFVALERYYYTLVYAPALRPPTLHNEQVVHRDLKPNNLLIDASGHCKVGGRHGRATECDGIKPTCASSLLLISFIVFLVLSSACRTHRSVTLG